MSPTLNGLKKHIKRTNSQALVWKRPVLAVQISSASVGRGWLHQDNDLKPVLMLKIQLLVDSLN